MVLVTDPVEIDHIRSIAPKPVDRPTGPSTVLEVHLEHSSMNIVRKYHGFLQYIYPIIINANNKHVIYKNTLLSAILDQPRLFYEASKTSQIGKLYIADSGLANIKELITFGRYIKPSWITEKQAIRCYYMLGEVGSMLGQWIKNKQTK